MYRLASRTVASVLDLSHKPHLLLSSRGRSGPSISVLSLFFLESPLTFAFLQYVILTELHCENGSICANELFAPWPHLATRWLSASHSFRQFIAVFFFMRFSF